MNNINNNTMIGLDDMARDTKKKRFYLTYRYNFRTKQKLDKLKDSERFNDYTEIIETGIDFLYEMLILDKLPERFEIVLEKVEDEDLKEKK